MEAYSPTVQEETLVTVKEYLDIACLLHVLVALNHYIKERSVILT